MFLDVVETWKFAPSEMIKIKTHLIEFRGCCIGRVQPHVQPQNKALTNPMMYCLPSFLLDRDYNELQKGASDDKYTV